MHSTPDRRATSGGPPGPWTHAFANVDGVRLHYVRMGHGAPLLLLHGWPGFWYEWAPVIAPLAERHDVVVPDLRGFAYSDKPAAAPERAYTWDVVATETAGFVRGLGLERLTIVAHDIGAVVAQSMARAFPDLVGRLVLFDPPYAGIGGRWREAQHVREVWYQTFHTMPFAERLVGASRHTLAEYLRHFLTHWSGRAAWVTEAELAHWVDAYLQPDALRGGFSYYRAFARVRPADTSPAALGIRQPTLVLWGERDAVLPVRWSDRLHEYFRDLTFKRVPGVGHFMMREAPDLVVAEVLAFTRSARTS